MITMCATRFCVVYMYIYIDPVGSVCMHSWLLVMHLIIIQTMCTFLNMFVCVCMRFFVCLVVIAIRVSAVQGGWVECAPVISLLPLSYKCKWKSQLVCQPISAPISKSVNQLAGQPVSLSGNLTTKQPLRQQPGSNIVRQPAVNQKTIQLIIKSARCPFHMIKSHFGEQPVIVNKTMSAPKTFLLVLCLH